MSFTERDKRYNFYSSVFQNSFLECDALKIRGAWNKASALHPEPMLGFEVRLGTPFPACEDDTGGGSSETSMLTVPRWWRCMPNLWKCDICLNGDIPFDFVHFFCVHY